MTLAVTWRAVPLFSMNINEVRISRLWGSVTAMHEMTIDRKTDAHSPTIGISLGLFRIGGFWLISDWRVVEISDMVSGRLLQTILNV